MGLPPADQEKVAKFFPNYIIVGVIDADVTEKHKPMIAGIAGDRGPHASSRATARTSQVLREVNPDVADLVPKLVYLLKASMGRLGEGLRLLPLSNISEKGEPIITASKPGLLGGVVPLHGGRTGARAALARAAHRGRRREALPEGRRGAGRELELLPVARGEARDASRAKPEAG